MRILVIGALTLLSAQAVVAQVPSVLLAGGDVISGPSGSWVVAGPSHPFIHRAGGRGCLTLVEDGLGGYMYVLWGSRAGEPESLLRVPETIGGVTQLGFIFYDHDVMDESGVFTYLCGIDDNQGNVGNSVWKGDTLLFAQGDPVPGAPGMVWGYIGQCKPTMGGNLIMEADIQPAGGGPLTTGLWVGSPPTLVLQSGAQLPGFSLPLNDDYVVNWGFNSQRVAVSRSGNHRLVVVRLDTGAQNNEPVGVTLDDLPLFVNGFVLEDGQPTPPSVAPNGTWVYFDSVWVDDSGSWQLVANYDDGAGGGGDVLLEDGVVVLRGGDVIPGVGMVQQIYAADANDRGDRVITVRIANHVHILLNGELLFEAGDPVDFDGDGVVDQTHTGDILSGDNEHFALAEDGTLLFNCTVSTPNGYVSTLLEIRGYELGASVCSPAVVNSTGLAAEIGAGGSAVSGGRPLRLRATDLPPNQFGYFLASRTQGFTANPGGSQGNLCLGGSIGRFVAQVAGSGAAGTLEIDVDTTAMPVAPTAPILAGESWTFQTWFRDFNPTPTSNFTDAVEITFE